MTLQPDVILTWPRNTDYPLWRQMLRDNRDKFNEVIIVFMETNYGDDYRQFLRDAMFQDHVLFVQSPPVGPGEDWRDVAVNAGLMHSLHSSWLWFTEQDFFFKDMDEAWKILADAEVRGSEYVGVVDGARLHPCCLFIRRNTLNKTKKFFGALPPAFDHFGQIQKDLEGLVETWTIINPDQYIHMAGLSHNMRLITDGEQPNHHVEEFKAYLLDCLEVTVPLHPTFKELAVKWV